AEHLIAALRCIYRHAENDGHIRAGENPALKVAKPRRLPSTRRAVPDTRLAEINNVAATTGNDPALDTLILRALLTFLWVHDHDRMRAHAVSCLEFPAYHSQRRSRWERCAHYEGMAAGAGGRAHGGRVGGAGARRAGWGGVDRSGAAQGRCGAALLAMSASLPGL
ncbi:MAG: hypothetical protein ACRDUV_00015, partial [Pseudonocardiaceae bacterium]